MTGLCRSLPPELASSPTFGKLVLALAVMLAGLACARPLRAADVGGSGAKPPNRLRTVAFARDIRPIPGDKCCQCHGPDAKQGKGKLRLDIRRDATATAESGSPAIVPGRLEESELYQRITAEDPEERMPPARSGKSLS